MLIFSWPIHIVDLLTYVRSDALMSCYYTIIQNQDSGIQIWTNQSRPHTYILPIKKISIRNEFSAITVIVVVMCFFVLSVFSGLRIEAEGDFGCVFRSTFRVRVRDVVLVCTCVCVISDRSAELVEWSIMTYFKLPTQTLKISSSVYFTCVMPLINSA